MNPVDPERRDDLAVEIAEFKAAARDLWTVIKRAIRDLRTGGRR